MSDAHDENPDDDWNELEPTLEQTQGTERQGEETLPNEEEPQSGGGSSGYSSWSSFGQPVPFSSGSGPFVDRSDAPSDINGSSILDAEDFVEGYVLREKLGQGAQGQVWRAFSRKYGRDVALKFAEARGSNRGLWERMREEARVLLDLTHASIVRLYDIAIIDKHLFLVTELIEGPTLHDILLARRRKSFQGANGFTVEECIWLVEQLVSAFEMATEVGIVHRDVKPSNIMLDREVDASRSLTESGALVKLCDFGVAYVDRGAADDVKVSPTGTKPFIAPEIEARRKPTLQADIYSLAATLVTLITGLSRKKDENFALMREAIKRARTIGLGSESASFDAAIMKALSA
ncbi:MAG: serine/threonine-protein kinase, partial [Planctomycetota bacterium]